MVRAKMICNVVKDTDHTPYGGTMQRQVTLNPVYDPDPESPNYSWSKYTPCGEVTLTITNPAALEQFEQGKTYFVDFSPAD